MWEKGFKLRRTGNRTFKIEGQFRAGRGGMGGIDFRFGFVYNKKRYDCYIETKNWAVYPLSPNMFQTEILDRFYNNANQPGCIWILTINRGYIRAISALCLINNIDIVTINCKITPHQLNIFNLRPIMEDFLDDFDRLMTKLTGVKLRGSRTIVNMPTYRPYDKAIVLGLPPSLIAQMYHTTPGNISKRKSELKTQGIDVLDGRSRTARLAKLMTVEDLDKVYRDILKGLIKKK